MSPIDPAIVRDRAQAWADTWSVAWPSRNADAITVLQAPDGLHWSSPFEPPHEGRNGLRAYLLGSFGAETARTRCRFAEPVVDGGRAAVEYWAQVEYGGEQATISGCTVLEFDEDGLVAESRDYSFFKPGHLPVPTQFDG
ncbi:MAG: nuclear transport factor 2 family protein [Nakamurella sp.]